MKKMYIDQVKLLLKVLPEFQPHHCFALKGGTAINLFVRDLPRLSVDLDFTYTPIADRESSLEEINDVSHKVAREIQRKISNIHVGMRKTKEGFVHQILIQQNLAAIKVDINHIIRGTVFPCQYVDLCSQAQKEFSFFCEANVLSFDDLYAGKICAALDRQHPRDFYDIKFLFDNEGISENLIEAFVIYLISHNRPIHELLSPNFHAFEDVFKSEFQGMAFNEVSYTDLLKISRRLLEEIHEKLTVKQREFLLSFKNLEPKWDLLAESHISSLPAVKWKLLNLKQLPTEKRKKQLALLQKVLNQNQ